MGRARSIVRTLNFKKADFFRELVSRSPWETFLGQGNRTELAVL